jgi:hypothetical protein
VSPENLGNPGNVSQRNLGNPEMSRGELQEILKGNSGFGV